VLVSYILHHVGIFVVGYENELARNTLLVAKRAFLLYSEMINYASSIL